MVIKVRLVVMSMTQMGAWWSLSVWQNVLDLDLIHILKICQVVFGHLLWALYQVNTFIKLVYFPSIFHIVGVSFLETLSYLGFSDPESSLLSSFLSLATTSQFFCFSSTHHLNFVVPLTHFYTLFCSHCKFLSQVILKPSVSF